MKIFYEKIQIQESRPALWNNFLCAVECSRRMQAIYCRIDSNQQQMNEYLCLNLNLIRRKNWNQKPFMPYAADTILVLFTILWVMKSSRNRYEQNRQKKFIDVYIILHRYCVCMFARYNKSNRMK